MGAVLVRSAFSANIKERRDCSTALFDAVGRAVPGSLPAGSRRLDDEGVVIPPTRLDDATLDRLVRRMRNPEERRGDLRAQIAAQRLAERRVAGLCERRGRELVVRAMAE